MRTYSTKKELSAVKYSKQDSLMEFAAQI